MNTEIKEIKINGIEYVEKSSIQTVKVNENYVIVRAARAGVFAGNLESKTGQTVVMTNCRRIWYWDGAASVSQLAIDGVSKPNNCKFPVAVPKIQIEEVIEIIPCTEKAIKSIAEVKVWNQ